MGLKDLIKNIQNLKDDNEDFLVFFDLETSCLNSKCAEIIEIAAVKVSNTGTIEEFSTLVKPKHEIEPQASEINRITIDMVQNAPDIKSVLKQFIKFIGNGTLIGHNISTFDIPILNRCSSETLGCIPSNDYIDTLKMSKERLYGIPNYKLSTIASYFAIDSSGAHRALADCYMNKRIYDELIKLPVITDKDLNKKRKFKTMYTDETNALQQLQGFLLGVIADNQLTDDEIYALKTWIDKHSSLAGNYPFDKVFATIEAVLEDGVISQLELQEMLDLFKNLSSPVDNHSINLKCIDFKDKLICLSGDFDTGTKSYVESLIINAGGLCKSSVTLKTNYVIVGSKGSADWSCGNYGTKIKRALELQEQGYDIQIIKEDELKDFFKKARLQCKY